MKGLEHALLNIHGMYTAAFTEGEGAMLRVQLHLIHPGDEFFQIESHIPIGIGNRDAGNVSPLSVQFTRLWSQCSIH